MELKRLNNVKFERGYVAGCSDIMNCNSLLTYSNERISVEHFYIKGVRSHSAATLPNGIRYTFYGNSTFELICELNAFIDGFNTGLSMLSNYPIEIS